MSSGEGDAVVQSSSAMAAAYSGPLPPPGLAATSQDWVREMIHRVVVF